MMKIVVMVMIMMVMIIMIGMMMLSHIGDDNGHKDDYVDAV